MSRALAVVALFAFCSVTTVADDSGSVGGAESLPTLAIPAVRIFAPPRVARGEVLRLFVVAPADFPIDSVSASLRRSGGYEVSAQGWRIGGSDRDGEVWQLLFGVASDIRPGPFDLLVAVNGVSTQTVIREAEIETIDRSYREEEILLSFALTNLRTREDEEKARQSRELWTLLQRTDLAAQFHAGRFILPIVRFRRTSLFGDRRQFRYVDGTLAPALHNGLDLAAPTGTLVIAPGRGRIAMAESRIVTGNTVVIEHQPGVYSLYYHLDRLDVAPGDLVRQGDVIGTVGSTGLATGPHLHWEVRVSGVAVDPEWFLGAPLVDTVGVDDALSTTP